MNNERFTKCVVAAVCDRRKLRRFDQKKCDAHRAAPHAWLLPLLFATLAPAQTPTLQSRGLTSSEERSALNRPTMKLASTVRETIQNNGDCLGKANPNEIDHAQQMFRPGSWILNQVVLTLPKFAGFYLE